MYPMYSGTNTFFVISASPKTCSRTTCSPGLCSGPELLGITEIEGGFPHSEIRGSKVVRTSPRLIAAYHVLHRLLAPRHPPDTLKTLDRSHYRCPPLGVARRQPFTACFASIERPVCFKYIRGRRGQAAPTCWCANRMVSSGNPCGFPWSFLAEVGCISSLRCQISRKCRSRCETCLWTNPMVGINRLVEPDGIEPTTSCLQSTRSPN